MNPKKHTPPRPADAPIRGDSAREAAFRRVNAEIRRFPNLILEPFEPQTGAGRDAAFARALHAVVVRHWLTIEWVLQHHLTKPLRDLAPRGRTGLLCGAAQLLYMDRVPPHAAIDHAVEWVKHGAPPGVARLTNAVLRRTAALIQRDTTTQPPTQAPDARPPYADALNQLPLGDGTALLLHHPILPDDPLERLAVVTSHPAPLLRRWAARLGIDETRRLALHSLNTPPIVLNTAHAREPLLHPLLAEHATPGHALWLGNMDELRSTLRQRPDIWVQDAGSARPVTHAASLGLRPSLIVDLCAGRGTKTRQLQALFPDAAIAATDIDAIRLDALRAVFQDNDRVEVLAHDQLIDRYAGRADLVVLDAPCSNTGVLARRPAAKYRFDERSLASLVELQRTIITQGLTLLRPGSLDANPNAAILYSTCSLEPEEDAEQARWFTNWHTGSLALESTSTPQGLPGASPATYSDGSYTAVIRSKHSSSNSSHATAQRGT